MLLYVGSAINGQLLMRSPIAVKNTPEMNNANLWSAARSINFHFEQAAPNNIMHKIINLTKNVITTPKINHSFARNTNMSIKLPEPYILTASAICDCSVILSSEKLPSDSISFVNTYNPIVGMKYKKIARDNNHLADNFNNSIIAKPITAYVNKISPDHNSKACSTPNPNRRESRFAINGI